MGKLKQKLNVNIQEKLKIFQDKMSSMTIFYLDENYVVKNVEFEKKQVDIVESLCSKSVFMYCIRSDDVFDLRVTLPCESDLRPMTVVSDPFSGLHIITEWWRV